MQKKVLAAVVGGLLVAPAAFAEVTISGRFADGLEQRQISQGNSVTSISTGYNKELRVTDQSSRIIFSGSEDMGGGMKAWFQLDNRFDDAVGASTNQNSQGFATGNTGVGLSGGWGKFTIGRWDLHYNELLSLDVNRAGSLQSLQDLGPMSQVNGVVIANGTRTSNVIMWDSANMGGITARVAYSTAPFSEDCGNTPVSPGVTGAAGANSPFQSIVSSGIAQDNCKGDALTGAVRYASGPLFLVGSYWTAKPETPASSPAGEQKSTKVGASYMFGPIKVGLGYDTSEVRATTGGSMVKRNAWMIPVTYYFGPHALYLNYMQFDKLSGATVTDDTGAKALTLGYDMALSKQTSWGVYYSDVKNDKNADYHLFATAANSALGALNGAGAVVGTETKQIYFGLAHNF